jgi:O-antigen ligase
VNKNSFLQSKVLRTNISLFAILMMLAGFFLSRAVLSMGMMLFGLNALIGVSPREWFSRPWWLLGLVWVAMYGISGLWSSDSGYWNDRFQVKLPILLLPLAFAFTPAFNYRQLRIFTIVLNLVLLMGVAYSFYFLLSNPSFYINGYVYSNILPTIPDDDHIVFSLSLALAVVWNVYFFPGIMERWLKIFSIISASLFIITLHVLAARTGLAGLYIFLFGWSIYLVLRKKTRLTGIAFLAAFILGGVIALTYLPTLKNRFGHFKWTVIIFKEGQRSGDYPDLGRFMSYDIALRLIGEHPLKGVGAGDLLTEMSKGYDRWYPQVKQEQRLIPHNQFLTVALVAGIPAALVFLAWVVYPVLKIRRSRSGFFFLITWLILLVPLLIEPFLEIQFGVFLYLFFLLWHRHAMRHPEQEDIPAHETKNTFLPGTAANV